MTFRYEDATIYPRFIKFRPKNIHKSKPFKYLNNLLDGRINYNKITMTLIRFDSTPDIYNYLISKDIEQHAKDLLPFNDIKMKTKYVVNSHYSNINEYSLINSNKNKKRITNNMCKIYPSKNLLSKLGKKTKSFAVIYNTSAFIDPRALI